MTNPTNPSNEARVATKEIDEWTLKHICVSTCDDAMHFNSIAAIVELALQREREACEKVAENPYGDEVKAMGGDEPKAVGNKIAAAIRNQQGSR